MKKTNAKPQILQKFEGCSSKVFGAVNKPPQPSMFQILSWLPSNPKTRAQDLLEIKTKDPKYYYNKIYQRDTSSPDKRSEKSKRSQKSQPSQKSKKSQRSQPSCQPHQIKHKTLQNNSLVVGGTNRLEKKIRVERSITSNLYLFDDVVPVVKRPKKNESPKKCVGTSKHKGSSKVKSQSVIIHKPPFEAYGRANTKGKVDCLKSHNILPHSGHNKPNKNQTYSSALYVATKSRPKNLKYTNKDKQEEVIAHFDLPDEARQKAQFQNHALANSLYRENNKKKGKKGKKGKYIEQEEEEEIKKEPPLKFMNKRGDFMQTLREEEMLRNRLALKPTQCYPGQYNIDAAETVKAHFWDGEPAGKKSSNHEDIREIFHYPVRRRQ